MRIKQVETMMRSSGVGRPYPSDSRARALEYAIGRRNEGAALARIAAEIGVSRGTLTKWIEPPTCSPFEVVAVTPTSRTHAVHGPRGVRVDGLSLEEVAELFRRLS
jgi:hypothetical protein